MTTLYKTIIIAVILCISGTSFGQKEVLKILSNGNVGIGTSTPEKTLHVNGDVAFEKMLLVNDEVKIEKDLHVKGDLWLKPSQKIAVDFGLDSKKPGIISFQKKKIGDNSYVGMINFYAPSGAPISVESTPTMTLVGVNKNSGNVGIGTSTPEKKLHVKGSSKFEGELFTNSVYINTSTSTEDYNHFSLYVGKSAFTHELPYYGYLSNGDSGTQLVTNIGKGFGLEYYTAPVGKVYHKHPNNYSIYAESRIAAKEFNAHSDARIKTIKGVSNAKKDLETLSKIQVTNYQMKDTIEKGTQQYKKVIAQQVKKVFPQAVNNTITQIVPNIYQASEINQGWVSLSDSNIKIGDKVKLIFTETTELVEVLEVTDKQIKVASKKEGKVFVYGTQVHDFHTVDYDAISMLNVSATQELIRQIEALKKENETIKSVFFTKIEALEAKMDRITHQNMITTSHLE
ncbi:endosialidase-like protein [Aquimarina sp. MAR_2010_214]|uniref:tail fiber domain-containing protein n=1 Tax=Aquimarina sp. MAR_2010_214 TaxID=1250026 RepID=UPI000C71519F|nr:tail fiber domain-containing protein [Aquimarina sp. MAR_2010_214]PKV50551.1 endosialidase-like protein [Aquimarina sp. MAR_2010_214]